jgi:hypothetical protein
MVDRIPSQMLDREALVLMLLRELSDDHRRELERRGSDSRFSNTLAGTVLDYGVGRYGARLPRGLRKLTNGPSYWPNAVLMLCDQGRFVYCDGYAISTIFRGLTLRHAWVLDRENGDQVVDTTWARPFEAVYLGIPFAPKFVRERMRKSGYYGVHYGVMHMHGEPVLKRPPERWLHPDAAALARDFSVSRDA